MKKFKRILLLLVTIVAGIIYFAEEIGSVLNEIEKEKKEVLILFFILRKKMKNIYPFQE